MIKSDLDRWMGEEGQKSLKEIGVRKGQTVLDFGCGEGHYTIPASKLVGKSGKVYALDKNRNSLNKLRSVMEQNNIKNINLINENASIALKDNSVDVALCYDVLHYLNIRKRRMIYADVYGVLKKEAIFSIYPKHHKGDSPSMELADVDLKGIIEEIEDSGFFLNNRFSKRLLHDDHYNEGLILNFKKGERNALD